MVPLTRRLDTVLSLSVAATVVNLVAMFILMLWSEAVQDKNEERPTLPKM